MSGQIYQDGLFISTGNVETVSEAAPFSAGQLGKTITIDEKTFRYVKRHSSGAINTQYFGVVWQDRANNIVTVAASAMPYAGIFLGDDDAADTSVRGMALSQYGYIQTAGPATIQSGAAFAKGAGLMLELTTGKFITATVGNPIVAIALAVAGGADAATAVQLIPVS